MILGHLTTTYAVAVPVKKRLPALSVGALIIGAFLPDMVDKNLHLLLGLPSRGIAHSAVVLSSLFYLLAIMLPAHRKRILSMWAGSLLHLVQDFAEPGIVFWPLMGAWQYEDGPGIFERIYNFYLGFAFPNTLLLEVASWPFCVYFLLGGQPSRAAGREPSVVQP